MSIEPEQHPIDAKLCNPSEPIPSESAQATGLDALFEKYVVAETEAREICEELQNSSKAFTDACARRDAAWEEYRTAKNASASNESPEPEYAKCRHCGSDKGYWFSRTVPMGNFCENCGGPWTETDGVE